MMIQAVVRMDVDPSKHKEALEILRFFAGRVRTKPGCMGCCIYQDMEDRHMIMLSEYWSDEERMQHHLRSRDYQNVLLVMEMARKEPEISFSSIAHRTGVETIETARLGHQDETDGKAEGIAGKTG